MKKFKLSAYCLLLALAIAFVPLLTNAALVGTTTQATLSLSPATGTYNANDNFTLSIYANTNGLNAVVVAAYLYYDKINFQAVNTDLTGSAFTTTFENADDATNGKIKITVAQPTQTHVNSANALVGKINFKALSATSPTVDNFTFDFTSGSTLDSNIIKDDGNGTDILSGVYNGKYTVKVIDITPPVISNVASTVTANSGTVTWTTNEAATSQVNYGLTTSYTSTTTLDSSLVTLHSANLTGLAAHTTYHYRVRTKDASGNENLSGDNTLITINTAPVITAVTITPSPAFKTTASLTANPSATDADSDTITYTYQWKKGGANITGQTAQTLANTNYVKNDVISVTVTPNDGRMNGNALTSANFTISNSLPTQPSVSITNPAYNSSNIVCTPSGSNDADGDTVTYAYAWYKNTVLQASQTTNTINASLTAVSDTWRCVVTPKDSMGNGPSGENSTTVMADTDTTPPVISSVVSITTYNSATITWTTNESATSQLNYGLTTDYGSTSTLDSNLVTSHTATITGLTANLYHFRIRTKDTAGNETVSGDYSFKIYATADLNSDGYVNSVDASVMMSTWGSAAKPKSDINQDGVVNSVDAGIMMSQWTG